MTTKNAKFKNCLSLLKDHDCCESQDTYPCENDYEQYLRRKHSILDKCGLFIKIGYITKENSILETPELTKRGKFLKAQFKMFKLVYDDIKDDILKIHKIVDKACDDIEFLETQNNSYEIGEFLVQTEVKAVAEEILDKLPGLINKIAEKSYKTIYDNLTEVFDDVLENTIKEPIDDLPKKELYNIINPWISDFKNWLFDGINSAFDDLSLDLALEKSYIQKGLIDDAFENVKTTFTKAKEKIDSTIANTLSHIQTLAQKIAFKVQRVESYEIILSGNPKTCEKCKSMAESSKDKKGINIAELSVGETAPPFHPNCGCTMIPYDSAEKEGSLWEQVVIGSNISFELLAQFQPWMKFTPIYQQIKSGIWSAGVAYLTYKNLPLAREMFTLGMYGGGKGMSKKATSLMVEAMQNSNALNDKIFKLTKSGKNFDTGKFSFQFENGKDTDLYYAVQNVNMRIVGTPLESGFWNIKVRAWDKYDFTTFRNSLEFADLANNLGEAMQRNGMMMEYDTLAEYEYVWREQWD